MFLPYLALTKWTIAPRLFAYSIAVLKLTSYFQQRSALLPTIAMMALAGPQAFSSSTQLCITWKECLEVMSKTQMAILAVLQQSEEIDLYFSWPAVSQRWNLMDLPVGRGCTLVKYAAPSVVSWKGLNFRLQKAQMIDDFPTPVSPRKMTLAYDNDPFASLSIPYKQF